MSFKPATPSLRPTCAFSSPIRTYVSLIHEVAVERGFVADWGHLAAGKYCVEVWDITPDKFSEVMGEASHRHLLTI